MTTEEKVKPKLSLSDDWWAQRAKWIEVNYTDNPQRDTYIVTVEVEITFARENDGVRNEAEAQEWLKHGDILESNDGIYEIVGVRKKGANP